MKKSNKVFGLSKQNLAKIVGDEALSKSAKMKRLFEEGMELKTIAETLDVRYNFVYNVISNYVNVNGIEIEKNAKAGKKEAIIELYKAGKTNKEISAELKTNYQYVYNTVKTYKKEHEVQDEVAVSLDKEAN